MNFRSLFPYFAALLSILIVTLFFFSFRNFILSDLSPVTLSFIIIVLLCASFWGTRPAIFAAIISILSLAYFFLKPIYSFQVSDPKDWFIIVMFFITAIVAGNLYTRAKGREEAEFAKKEIENLYKDLQKENDERKQIEMDLRARTDELTRSNEELEQFAYVASHDLQEPLRLVASFSQLLALHYKGKLDEEADKYIEYIVEAALRMQQLILDLLDYSRITTRGKEFAPVNSENVLNEAILNLKVVIGENNAIISHEPLPTIMGDYSQLVQLFQNLLSNAIKFCGDDQPNINISAEIEGDNWVFQVKDNGIGIEPQYHKRIFEVFERLHERSEYSGTGIGLAISKNIVERHGGRIWVESELNKGSTFYFTIPNRRK
jgi:signal transduction histidine kinase